MIKTTLSDEYLTISGAIEWLAESGITINEYTLRRYINHSNPKKRIKGIKIFNKIFITKLGLKAYVENSGNTK